MLGRQEGGKWVPGPKKYPKYELKCMGGVKTNVSEQEGVQQQLHPEMELPAGKGQFKRADTR